MINNAFIKIRLHYYNTSTKSQGREGCGGVRVCVCARNGFVKQETICSYQLIIDEKIM